jgi:hypothetical protein
MSRELLQHLKKSHKQHQQQALQLQEQLSLLSEELEGIPVRSLVLFIDVSVTG